MRILAITWCKSITCMRTFIPMNSLVADLVSVPWECRMCKQYITRPLCAISCWFWIFPTELFLHQQFSILWTFSYTTYVFSQSPPTILLIKVHSLNSSKLISSMHPSEHTFLKTFKNTRSHVLSGVKLSASPRAFKPDNILLLVFQTVPKLFYLS